MTQERLSMRKIAEVLRLKWACNLTNREIGRSCSISHSTVSEYVKRAEVAEIKWPIPETLTEDELYQLLFPEKVQAANLAVKPLPDWEKVRKELKKRNVTLHLLWEEYREAYPFGYGYSQYCELYSGYVKKLDPPMRQNHKAGEKLFVDYAGDTIPIVNPETGEIRQAYLFVAVLGASSYTYTEAQVSQEMRHWIGGHVRAFAFMGGVPQIIVPDNLKQGVKSPCWYDPDLKPNLSVDGGALWGGGDPGQGTQTTRQGQGGSGRTSGGTVDHCPLAQPYLFQLRGVEPGDLSSTGGTQPPKDGAFGKVAP